MGSIRCLCLWYISLCIAKVQSDSHRLVYLYSAFTRPDGSSVFSAVGLFDDRRISHYSNELKTWKRDDPDSDIWREPPDSRDRFLHEIKTLSNCTSSRCDGLHTLQRRIGCVTDKSLDGEDVKVNAFDEYGYDGEDFIVFNPDTMQWTDKNPKAEETKLKWNNNSFRNQYLKTYLNNCWTWISTLNASVTSPPDVQMFASEAPHDRSELNLTCLATGFYPKHIEMKITLNAELQPFISTGVRPNNNETFQMRVSVRMKRNESNGYECHVIHNSWRFISKLNGKSLSCSEGSRRHDVAFTVAVFAFLVAYVFIWCICVGNVQNQINAGQTNWPDHLRVTRAKPTLVSLIPQGPPLLYMRNLESICRHWE